MTERRRLHGLDAMRGIAALPFAMSAPLLAALP